MLAAKRQDGGLFKGPPYPGYPFIMIPDLTGPYLPNGSLSPTARTVSDIFLPFPLRSCISPLSLPLKAPACSTHSFLPPPTPGHGTARNFPKLCAFRRTGGRGVVYTSPCLFLCFQFGLCVSVRVRGGGGRGLPRIISFRNKSNSFSSPSSEQQTLRSNFHKTMRFL